MTHTHRCPVDLCDRKTQCCEDECAETLVLCPTHEEWVQCAGCGERFEDVDDDGFCGPCSNEWFDNDEAHPSHPERNLTCMR